jgi:protein phosphatase
VCKLAALYLRCSDERNYGHGAVMEEFTITYGAVTHVGQVRTGNEDSLLADNNVFMVADGMGGHNAGEVASLMAVEQLREAAGSIIAETDLVQALEQANEVIYAESMTNHLHHGMGTTLAAMVVLENNTLVVAHVGDSRVYMWNEGALSRLSKDHSYVQELVDEGIVSIEEARTHPRRNIVTRALGIDADVEVEANTFPVTVGAWYVLCSDGLVDEISDADIAKVLERCTSPHEAAQALVDAANAAGGRDNITVIVVSTALPEAEVVEPVEVPSSSGVDDTDPAGIPVVEKATAASAPASASAKKKFRFGPVLFWSALGGIVLAVLVVFAAYGRTGYFVSFQGDDVVVLKGRPGGVLWFNPTVEARTTLTRSDLTDALALEIAGEPTFSESSAAQTYVNGIRDEVQPNPTTTLPAVVTTTTSSTSTTSSTTSTVVK